MLHYAMWNRLIKAYQSPIRGLVISYLLFVDDSLLVAKAIVVDVTCLRAIVDAYYNICEPINFSKSQIMISLNTLPSIKSQIQRLLQMN